MSPEGKRRGRAQHLHISSPACSRAPSAADRSRSFSGRCRKREYSRYGCSAHAQRGDSFCKNSLLVRRLDLERQLVAGLEETVLHPAVVDYTLTRLRRAARESICCATSRRCGPSPANQRARARTRKPASRVERRILAGNYDGDRQTGVPSRRAPRTPQLFRSRNNQVPDARHATLCGDAAQKFERIMER